MSDSIKRQLTTLAALQQTEIAIGKIEAALDGVDAIIEAIGSEVKLFQEKNAQQRAIVVEIKKQYREDENEIKTIENRITRSDEKLRAVKTNKEYQSMLKEIDELKNRGSDIEDRMLLLLDEIEKGERDIALLDKELESVKVEVEARHREIREKANQQQLQLAGYKEERDTIWRQLSPELQQLFSKVKKQGAGIAVAAIVEGVCQVCRMNIPPQMFNELLRLDVIRLCPHCQRIIYPKILIEKENG